MTPFANTPSEQLDLLIDAVDARILQLRDGMDRADAERRVPALIKLRRELEGELLDRGRGIERGPGTQALSPDTG